MKKVSPVWYIAIIAVCFLYTGSAYMSQCYRLMDYYDERTVDVISSVYNYLCQALGMLIFSIGLVKKPKLFGRRYFFAGALLTGAVFMAIMQLSASGPVIVAMGLIFNIHIGLYFGCYLSLFSRFVPAKHAGVSFGIAYAIGSVGTYIFSLIGDGEFLVKKEVLVIYLLLAAVTVAIALIVEDINKEDSEREASYINVRSTWKEIKVTRIVIILCIMMMISVIGSGLFYSLPIAESVNWNLIRAFYAAGLILAGFIMDRSRIVGEVCTIASLTFALIAMALIGEGVTNTVVLGISYALRGFITIYYVITFTRFGAEKSERAYLAPVGLMISRAVEAVISLVLMFISIPGLWQLIFTAICFIPLLMIYVLSEHGSEDKVSEPMSDDRRLAMFCERYGLTTRETEILVCLKEGLQDSEIAERLFISKNTVRFHVSNLLKKTESDSRVNVVRSLDMFEANGKQ